jgi:hypothetical protein
MSANWPSRLSNLRSLSSLSSIFFLFGISSSAHMFHIDRHMSAYCVVLTHTRVANHLESLSHPRTTSEYRSGSIKCALSLTNLQAAETSFSFRQLVLHRAVPERRRIDSPNRTESTQVSTSEHIKLASALIARPLRNSSRVAGRVNKVRIRLKAF